MKLLICIDIKNANIQFENDIVSRQSLSSDDECVDSTHLLMFLFAWREYIVQFAEVDEYVDWTLAYKLSE
jgi:hypothetical protein